MKQDRNLVGALPGSGKARWASASLGVTAAHVRRLVLREGLVLTATGAAAGLALALVTTRTLRSLLYEIDPLDPVSLGGAAVMLATAAVLATLRRATRAARVDPVEMLRAQ